MSWPACSPLFVASGVPLPHPPSASVSLAASCALLPAATKRRFEWDDDFFQVGNEERERGAKNFRYGAGEVAKQVAPGAEAQFDDCVDEFECDIDGCHLVFSSLSAFDDHYLTAHTFKCEICGLRLPNNRLLEMHIQERHDELFRVMARTKRMYSCLVEGCDQKSRTRKGRQLHLVDKHAYPPNYTYDRQVRRAQTRATRRKEKPHRVHARMSDEDEDTAVSPPSSLFAAASSAAVSSSAAAAAASAASTSAPRPVTSSRSSILAFMPRAVRANTSIAKAQTTTAAVSGMKPAASLPRSSLAFTEMRDSPPVRTTVAPPDDSMHDAVAEADSAIRASDSDSAAPLADSDSMDIDAEVGLSRLQVDRPTMPKKLTFGARNRRHA